MHTPLHIDLPENLYAQVFGLVEAGECLHIPRLWWHQVESLETNASPNLRFATGRAALLAAAARRYARWRGLRSWRPGKDFAGSSAAC